MTRWPDIWTNVQHAVLNARTRDEACRAVAELRGKPTSWEALARAWRRYSRAGDAPCDKALGMGLRAGAPLFDDREPPLLGYGAITWIGEEPEEDEYRPVVEAPLLATPPKKYVSATPQKHLWIGDGQCEQGVPDDHWSWVGRYIADKWPDTVIIGGDHWDMPSLSMYESKQAKAARGACKKGDIDAGNRALELMEEELAKAGWDGRRILLEGNHDGFANGGRPYRYLQDHPDDRGILTPDLFADSWLGWERIPFLQPIEVDGILYCHLFPLNKGGKVTTHAKKWGCASAEAQIHAVGQSCTAGHKQGLSIALANPPFGPARRGLIAGSFYQHDHAYSAPAKYWRGVILKHSVGPDNPNHYDLCEVPLSFLKEKYS